MSALSSGLRRCSCDCRQSPIGLSVRTTQEPIITARFDWADIGGGLARPALRPRQPQHGLAGRHARPPPGNCVDDPCNPPLHAPHRAPRLGPSRRRALRAARRDVWRPRGHPLSRARAARSRGGLEAARHACRSLGAGRLRQLRMHREDVGCIRGQVRSVVPRGLAGAGDRLFLPARVLGDADSRRRRRERARVTRTACCRRPASSAWCIRTTSAAACGRTGQGDGRAGNGCARASGASLSLAATLTLSRCRTRGIRLGSAPSHHADGPFSRHPDSRSSGGSRAAACADAGTTWGG